MLSLVSRQLTNRVRQWACPRFTTPPITLRLFHNYNIADANAYEYSYTYATALPFPTPVFSSITPSTTTATTTTTCTAASSLSSATPVLSGILSDYLTSISIWWIKRTFQPSILRKKRKHGWLNRSKSVGGRKILKRRKAKGRARLFGA